MALINFPNSPALDEEYTHEGRTWKHNGTAWLAATTSSGSALTVQDEGSTLSAAVTQVNFIGAGVTATGTTSVTVDIPISGMHVVNHGSTAATARPAGAAAVYWIGTVEPTNALNDDLWIGGL